MKIVDLSCKKKCLKIEPIHHLDNNFLQYRNFIDTPPKELFDMLKATIEMYEYWGGNGPVSNLVDISKEYHDKWEREILNLYDSGALSREKFGYHILKDSNIKILFFKCMEDYCWAVRIWDMRNHVIEEWNDIGLFKGKNKQEIHGHYEKQKRYYNENS